MKPVTPTSAAPRLFAVAALAVMLSGCTAMLLGGGNSDGTRLGSGGQSSQSSTQAAKDNAITSTVRHRLSDDAVLGRYDLDVETMNGRVVLHGTVGTYEARERAARLAGAVEGAQRVDNRIRVSGGT